MATPKKKPVKKPLKTTKKPIKKAVSVKRSEDGIRLRKLPRRQQAKQQKEKTKVLQRQKELPKAWNILRLSLRHLYRHKKAFLIILAIYGLLYVLFVKGISANFQLGNLRQSLTSTFSGKLGSLGTGVALYGLLLGTAGSSSSATAGVYQTLLIVVVSLALIWALRTSYAGKEKIRAKDSYYKGMHPLVPFIIVSLVVIIQSLPAIIVGALYGQVENSGVITGSVQQGIALLVLGLGLFWSFYMLSSSLFALYIVTLPGATPLNSLRAARKLVRFRRAAVVRKIFFLPVVLLLASAIILIPLIIFIAPAAEVLFTIFTILVLGVVHSYLYTLYRSLLNDKA